jgi:hypothetical protein
MVGTSVGWVEDFKKNSLGFRGFFLLKMEDSSGLGFHFADSLS